MPTIPKQKMTRARREAITMEKSEAAKDFILLMADTGQVVIGRPTEEALRIMFGNYGYTRVRVTQKMPLVWRVTASSLEKGFVGDADAIKEVRAIVREIGERAMRDGVGIERRRDRISFTILLEPKDGVWPRPEEFLPERFRQPPPEEHDDLLDYV